LLAYNETYTVGLGAAVAADGSFVARRLRAGTWRLYFYAAAEGYLDDFARDEDDQRLSFELSGPGDEVEVEVPLRLGAQLTGVVRDDAGEPVYGASVRSSHENGTEYRARSVRTDRDGSYTLVGLAPGLHILDVSYAAYCDADPDYVPWYVPGTPHELAAEFVEIEGGQVLEMDWELPVDSDHDGMSDAWEREHGLDVGRDDADEDPDDDGLTNLEEYWLGLDPFDSDQAPRCSGCGSTVGGLWLLPLILLRRRRD